MSMSAAKDLRSAIEKRYKAKADEYQKQKEEKTETRQRRQSHAR